MGATLQSLLADQGIHANLVIAIEGCSYLITDGDPDAAVAAWDGTGWFTAISGLKCAPRYKERIEPFSDRLEAEGLTFSVVPDAGDRFGIDTHRRDPGAETFLREPMDAETLAMQVDSNAAFDTPTNVQVGREVMAATSKSGDHQLTVTARGLFAPFKAHGETLQRFAYSHRLPSVGNSVQIKPSVTENPVNWIGRWVGVWMHRNRGGVLDTKAEAHLLWAGRITDIFDDPDTGETVVEMEHAKAAFRDAVILRDQFTGALEGTYFHDGTLFEIREQSYFNVSTQQVVVKGGLPVTLTFRDNPSGDDEAQAGLYTAEELVARIQQWFTAKMGDSAIDGAWTARVVSTTNGPRVELKAVSPSGTVSHRVKFRAIGSFFYFLGLSSVPFMLDLVAEGGGREAAEVGEQAPFRFLAFGGSGSRIVLNNTRGTWFNNLPWFPLQMLARTDQSGQWGVFDIGGMLLLAKRSSDTEYTDLVDLQPVIPGAAAFELPSVRMGEGGELRVRQVAILGGFGFQEAFSHLSFATGTTDYNHPQYDKLPAHLGAGIPWELLGDEFVESLQALEEGTTGAKPFTVIIEKPTRLWDIFKSDFMIRRAALIWKQGKIRAAQLGLPTSQTSAHVLTPDEMADPGGVDSPSRSATRTTNEWLTNVIKIENDRAIEGSYGEALEFRDEASVQAFGEHVKTLQMRNAYGSGELNNIDDYAAMLVGQLLPVFARPLVTLRSPMAPTLFEAVAPADGIAVTDPFPRDPEAGERGISGIPATVTGRSYSWGSADDPMGGEVEFFFSGSLQRAAVYSPAGEVDETKDDDGYTAGYNSSTGMLRLKERAHTAVGFGDEVDASFFASGDEVAVVEIDPDSPSGPLSWEVTLASVTGNDLEVGALDGFDSDKLYRVVSQAFSEATTTQRTDAYQAGDTGTVEGMRAAYRYALETLSGVTVVASPQSLPERHAAVLHGDGAPMSPAQHIAAARAANNLLAYKTAPQGGNIRRATIGASEADGWQLVLMTPIFVGPSQSGFGTTRKLNVAPWIRKEAAGSDAEIRVTLSTTPPIGSTRQNVSFFGIARHATYVEASANLIIAASQEIDLPNTTDGLLWLSVEFKVNTETRGIGELWNGPYGTSLVNFRRFARNGVSVQGAVQPLVAAALNRVGQRIKKPFLRWGQDLSDIPSGSASEVVTGYWHGHTGLGTTEIRVVIVMALDDTGNATDPTAEVALLDAAGDLVDSQTFHYGATDDTPADAPSEFGYFQATFAVDEDTTYTGAILLGDYARLVACLVYEAGDPLAPIVATSGYEPNAQILAAQVQEQAETATALIRRNGAVWFNWTADSDADAPAIGSSDWTNIIDGTTSYNAGTSAGWKVERTYHNTRSRTTVPVRFAVLCEQGATTDGEVRLIDSTGALLVADDLPTSAGWVVVEGSIAAGTTKIDVQARRTGDAGEVTVYAVSVYEYEEDPPPPAHETINDIAFSSAFASLESVEQEVPDPPVPPAESLAPDAIIAGGGNYSGTLSDLQRDPDSDSTTEALTDAIRMSFPTPSTQPDGTQELRIRLDGVVEDIVEVYLYEDGSEVTLLYSDEPADGVLSIEWNAASLSGASGADAEILIVPPGSGMNLGGIRWVVGV